MARDAKGPLRHLTLEAKERARQGTFPEALGLRVHRAISWLGRAESESQDPDVRFILLWIGFNALYGTRIPRTRTKVERGVFKDFFRQLVKLDSERRVFDAVWERFAHEIRTLLANKYVFAPFWDFHNGISGSEDWEHWFGRSGTLVSRALSRQDTVVILSVVFDRLYVLRNQLVHGGATWRGRVNRAQVRDGAAVLGWMLPLFVDIMMDSPTDGWGPADYPVVE